MGTKTIRKVQRFKEEKVINNAKCHGELKMVDEEYYLDLKMSEILCFCSRKFSRILREESAIWWYMHK